MRAFPMTFSTFLNSKYSLFFDLLPMYFVYIFCEGRGFITLPKALLQDKHKWNLNSALFSHFPDFSDVLDANGYFSQKGAVTFFLVKLNGIDNRARGFHRFSLSFRHQLDTPPKLMYICLFLWSLTSDSLLKKPATHVTFEDWQTGY